MAEGKRIPKYMEILDKYNEVNSSWNWEILDGLTDEELLDESKVTEKICIIKKHQIEIKNNPTKYSEDIMECLRQRWGLDRYDTSKDEKINRMSPDEVLEHVCNWNGLLAYAYTIKSWIEDIYKVNLNKRQ